MRFTPLLEIAVAGTPFGVVLRQHPPLAAAFEHIGHAAENFVSIHFTWACFLPCPLQNREDVLECLATDITGIRLAHTRSLLKRTWHTRNSSKDHEQALSGSVAKPVFDEVSLGPTIKKPQ